MKANGNIPSTNWATNTDGKSPFSEISSKKRRSSPAEEARRVNGFMGVRRQSIMTVINPTICSNKG